MTTSNTELLGNYTVTRAATILGFTSHGIRTQIKDRKLPCIVSGRRYMIRKVVVYGAAQGLVTDDLFAMDRQLADGVPPGEVFAYWLKHGRKQEAPSLHGSSAKSARTTKKAARRGTA